MKYRTNKKYWTSEEVNDAFFRYTSSRSEMVDYLGMSFIEILKQKMENKHNKIPTVFPKDGKFARQSRPIKFRVLDYIPDYDQWILEKTWAN